MSRRHSDCRGSLAKSKCNATAAPYSLEAPIKARWGNPDEVSMGVCRPRLGGKSDDREEVVTITGRFMLPTDIDTSQPGYKGSPVPAGVPWYQLESQASRYLKVTFGDKEEGRASCTIWQVATGRWHCKSTSSTFGAMGGIRYGVPFNSVTQNNGTHFLTCDHIGGNCCLPVELIWQPATVGDGTIGSVMSTGESAIVMLFGLRCPALQSQYASQTPSATSNCGLVIPMLITCLQSQRQRA